MSSLLIKFTDEMAEAVYEGRKTMTRRPLRPQPADDITEILHAYKDEWLAYVKQKYGQDHEIKCPYGKAGDIATASGGSLIGITEIRVERLRDITEGDIIKEGCPNAILYGTGWFKDVWKEIYGAAFSWDSNPWVWVISFRRLP